MQPRRAASLFYLGYTWLHLGEYDQAVECGQATLSLAELIDNQEVISQSIVLSATAALANGDYAKALDEFEKVAKAQIQDYSHVCCLARIVVRLALVRLCCRWAGWMRLKLFYNFPAGGYHPSSGRTLIRLGWFCHPVCQAGKCTTGS